MDDTNNSCKVSRVWAENSSKAWHTILGPISEPPTPMLTTVLMGWPSKPSHSPACIFSTMLCICCKLASIWGCTLLPSTLGYSPEDWRNAVWSAGRNSLSFTMPPLNRFSMAVLRSLSLASCVNKSRVFGVKRCLERSNNMFWSWKDSWAKRLLLPASNNFIKALSAISFWKCLDRAIQAGVFGVARKESSLFYWGIALGIFKYDAGWSKVQLSNLQLIARHA